MIFMYAWLVIYTKTLCTTYMILLSCYQKSFQCPFADNSSREHSREQKFKSLRLSSVLSLKKLVNIHNLLFYPP